MGAGSGLGGLLEQMQRAGFGDQARSWVGTGQNMSISPDAIGQIFGQGDIDEIARHANLTPEQTSEGLSQLRPEVVDRVRPGRSRISISSSGAWMVFDGKWEGDHRPDHRRDRGADRRPGEGNHAVGAHRWSCFDRERAPPPRYPVKQAR
jgi:YidB-like protein